MYYSRPIVLSIAGFDPCAGAGVLADIKTFEQHKCLGMAVNTAITNQVEDKFISVNWLSLEEIKEPLKQIFNRYHITYVKIGIIENIKILSELIDFLKQQNENIQLIWDPVLSASSGFHFIENWDKKLLEETLKKIYLLVPNTNEATTLTGMENKLQAAQFLASFCHVLLKGGHSEAETGLDYLFYNQKQLKIPAITSDKLAAKHGSGCILSSAVTANLALGHNIDTACQQAKIYIERILKSNSNLLAYHVA